MDYIYEPIRNKEGVVIDAKDNALPIKKKIVEKTKELLCIRLDTLFYDLWAWLLQRSIDFLFFIISLNAILTIDGEMKLAKA